MLRRHSNWQRPCDTKLNEITIVLSFKVAYYTMRRSVVADQMVRLFRSDEEWLIAADDCSRWEAVPGNHVRIVEDQYRARAVNAGAVR